MSAINVGDIFVYQQHGVVQIKKIYPREILDESGEKPVKVKADFAQLLVLDSNLQLDLPVSALVEAGFRNVSTDRKFGDIVKAFKAPTDEDENWSRRKRNNLVKITSGDIVQLTELIRDLSRREVTKGISKTEKDLLKKGRSLLFKEVAIMKKVPLDKSQALIEDLIADNIPDASALFLEQPRNPVTKLKAQLAAERA